jgi:hypothetical protein
VKAGDEHAGKRVRCPGCQNPLVLPAAVLEVEAVEEVQEVEEVEEGITETPRKPRPRRRDDEDDEDRPRRRRRDEEDDEDEDRRDRGRRDEEDDEDRPRKKRRGDAVRCYKCGSRRATKISWTWWGGIVAPAMFSMVRCDRCGTSYNGKTGGDNTMAITIYNVVTVVLALIVGVLSFIAARGRW